MKKNSTSIHIEEIEPSSPVQKSGGRPVKKKKKGRIRKFLFRLFMTFVILIMSVVLLFFGALTMIHSGQYPRTQALFVNTVMETSALKFMAQMYLSDSEIKAIIDSNTVDDFGGDTTDPGEIVIPTQGALDPKDEDGDGIVIIDIEGATYKGKLMIVADPSRIAVATIPQFGEGFGKRTHEIIIANDAVAGINAGGFLDYYGKGDGGTPDGIIIQQGKIKYGSLGTKYDVIGFDSNNILILGNMTGQEALDKGVQEAVSFGPFLIMNGVAAQALGTGGGLNPRTAIGQRKDGAVLLLVIDGRQPSSLGALYTDLIDIMLEYGAVNAANLDGGSSTVMVFHDEIINSCVSLYGPRKTPSAIIVK